MRQYYHGDCEHFFTNGAVRYCGFFHGYPSCPDFKACEVHEKQRNEEAK